MILEFETSKRYQCIEETRIETEFGGMIQGQDCILGRNVAIKYIRLEGDTDSARQAAYDRASTEVRAMTRLGEERLPIPQIYDTHYDGQSGTLYLVMEWIKGTTLAQQMQVNPRIFVGWMMDLANILAEMERKRMYHKDIKPANLMITPSRQLVLIDFNLTISTPNLVEGTAHYKAPEMSPNSRYPGRDKVDMFAVGVMLYQYYTGDIPLRGRDYAQNRRRGPFAWDVFVEAKEKNPQIPSGINEIINTCMQLDPKMRYRNNGELCRALRAAMRSV